MQPVTRPSSFFSRYRAGVRRRRVGFVFGAALLLEDVVGAGIFAEHGSLIGFVNAHVQAVPRQVQHPVEALGAAVEEDPQQVLLHAAAAHLQPVGRQHLLVDGDALLRHDPAVHRGDLPGQGQGPLVLVDGDDLQPLVRAAGGGRQAADAAADDQHLGGDGFGDLILGDGLRGGLPTVALLWGAVGIELHFQFFLHVFGSFRFLIFPISFIFRLFCSVIFHN